MRLYLRFVFLTLISSLLTIAQAQVAPASILGTIRDPSGAVIPKASVTATNLETNFSRQSVTGSNGNYLIPFLPVGRYRLEASAPGFKSYSQSGVVLDVGTRARVDVVLEVGPLSEAINVVADAAQVDTTDAQLGRTVENAEIEHLPLVNRDVYALLNLTPGVQFSAVNPASFGYPEQRVMINGGSDASAGSVNFFLDGGSNSLPLRNTGGVIPNPDAVAEFRVATNSYSAEFGRFAGGVVDVVTKSGTNQLHGSVFEFLRNDKANANSWGALRKPPLRRNQFGVALGGPIRKDKTFFFLSYSGLRQRLNDLRTSAVVPDTLQRSGDFSALRSAILDPDSKTPFALNQVPETRFDPAASTILKQSIPAANLPGNIYEASQPHPTNSDEGLLKIDHNLSPRQLLSGSYFVSNGYTELGFLSLTAAEANLPWARERFGYRQHNLNLGDTWTISPSSVNQFRLTWMRNYGSRLNTPRMSLGDLGSKFQIQGTPSLPQISVSGYFLLGQQISGTPSGGNTYAARDVLALTHGRHSIRVGGDWSLTKLIHTTNLNNYGVFVFDGSRSGNALADFLLGAVKSMNQDAPVRKADNSWYYGLFLQDDIRVHPRLVLNLGLRYDLQLPYTDPQNRKITFVPGMQSRVVPSAPLGILFPGDPGVGRGIVAADKDNFGPRVGLAWDPTGKGRTSVRAAAGLFYGSISGNLWNSTADRLPFAARQQFNNVKSLSDPYANFPGGVSPYPYVYDPQAPRFLLPSSIAPISLDFTWPYTYQLNFTVEHQFARDLDVGASYVGALSHHLPFSNDVNYPNFTSGATSANVDARRPYLPGTLSSVIMLNSNINSAYHGLQITANRRFARGFLARAYYTYGKSLQGAQIASDVPTGGVEDARNLRLERGRADYDYRHGFVFSGIWQIGLIKNRAPVLRTVARGWSLSGILSLRSGLGFSVLSGRDNNLDGVNNDRANITGNPRLDPHRSRTDVTNRWFDIADFTPPASGQDGNSGRNAFDGPGSKTLDLALFRDFRPNERLILQFRVEMTNALNQVNLGQPNATLTSPQFGTIRSANAMRQVQFGLRLAW